MSELADRIKLLRGKKSREEFSLLIDISPRALVTYEQNERIPKVDLAERICAKTGANPEWFLMGKGSMYASTSSPSVPSDSEKMGDMSPILKCLKKQNTEITNIQKREMGDTSLILESQQEINALNRELRDLLRENGDLRVDNERKKARIAELERELVRVLKSEEYEDLASAG